MLVEVISSSTPSARSLIIIQTSDFESRGRVDKKRFINFTSGGVQQPLEFRGASAHIVPRCELSDDAFGEYRLETTIGALCLLAGRNLWPRRFIEPIVAGADGIAPDNDTTAREIGKLGLVNNNNNSGKAEQPPVNDLNAKQIQNNLVTRIYS